MKKIIIFIFITNFSFAQTGIEIRLVDYNIGRPISNNLSNDVGLNLILEKYGTILYESKGPHPLYDTLIFQIDCTSLNLNEFVADLQSYSSVVAYVHLADKNLFSDVLRTHIMDVNIGTPTGSNDNIITTNDPGLNQIFQNLNVYYY